MRNTRARKIILEMLRKSKAPVDARYIYKKIQNLENTKKINEVTVYRTLTSFEKDGLLRRVDLRKDAVYFELSENHHHHMVCTKCDTVEDFKNPEIEKILKRVAEKSSRFKQLTEHSLELFGLCSKCI